MLEGLGWPQPQVTRVQPKAQALRVIPGTTQVLWIGTAHPRLLATLFALEGPAEFGQLVLASLSHRDIELIVLRATWNAGHFYHWAAHAAWARIREHRGFLDAVKVGAEDGRWTARQAALLWAVDELHGDLAISPQTMRELREHGYQDRHIIEICFITAHYQLLGMLEESAGMPGEMIFGSPDPAEDPAPRRPRPATRPENNLDGANPWLPGGEEALDRHGVLSFGLRNFGRAMARLSTVDPVQVIAALKATGDSADPQESAVRHAVTQLDREFFIRDETWQRLEELFTTKQILELCVLVGHYRTYEMIVNTLA